LEIKINNKSLDVTLENEKTLGDVIHGLDHWLESSGYSITGIEKDGQAIFPAAEPDESWKEAPLRGINTLNFIVLSQSERYAESLYSIYQFLTLLQKGIKADNKKLIEELKLELPHVVKNIDSYLGGGQGYGSTLQKLVESSGLLDGELKAPVNKLVDYSENLTTIISSRLAEIVNPVTEMKSTAVVMKKLLPKLAEVSVLLQTGRDREAMNLIIEFAEVSDKLIRLHKILDDQGRSNLLEEKIQNRSFEDFYSDFNKELRELEEAFHSRDSVLIGDLLEYEIAPKVEELTKYIDEFEESKKGNR